MCDKYHEKKPHQFSTHIVGTLLFVCFTSSCGGSIERQDLYDLDNQVIYGQDDRIEYYQATDIQQQAADRVFLVVDKLFGKTLTCLSKYCQLNTKDYTQIEGIELCDDEPFRGQPCVLAGATAFLVADDLVATAGHVFTEEQCPYISFIPHFLFKSEEKGPAVRFGEERIFQCDSKVIHFTQNNIDFAVWKLDRGTGTMPLCIRRSGNVKKGTPLIMMGHPIGLPLKIAGNAQSDPWASPIVKSIQKTYTRFAYEVKTETFRANLDAYVGNSGSPVFDANTMEVQGILIDGSTDYTRDSDNECIRSNVCSDLSGCPDEGFEIVVHSKFIAPYVPQVECFDPNS